MPFPPPPPPPGPPPPTFGSGAPKTARPDEGRNLLLQSIRQGTALKKAVTNDRSAPQLGKVSNVSNSNNNNSNSGSPRNNNNYGGGSDAARNGLGGLFAGGMPKLKPTGRGGYGGNTAPQSELRNTGVESSGNTRPNLSSSQKGVSIRAHVPTASSGRGHSRVHMPSAYSGRGHNQHGVPPKSPKSVLNRPGFKFDQPQSQEPVRRPFPGDIKNRGPPPQPPPSTQKPTMPTSASDSVLTGSGSLLGGRSGSNSFNSHDQVNNRSFLHGGGGPPSLPSKPPVGGYGKPNLAPKPPGIAPNTTNISSKPSPPPKKQVVNGAAGITNRVPVTRAHSMRVPRSPPVAPPHGPPFPPSSKNLGNYRGGGNAGLPSFHQSQDSLHQYRTNPPPPPRTATLPSNLNHHGMKPAAPQPPPSTPPPPTPSSGSNRPGVAPPMRPPVARPPPPPSRPMGSAVNPPLCPPPPPPTSAPPPPPHRTSPAPPPPSLQTRLAPAVPSSAPPPPPVRNTSIRNGPSSACTELEARFSEYFHSVHEFPTPQPFQRVCKVYNSRNVFRNPSI
ncbi:WAS/WASL-interacting protein family member 1-like isoform X2 [Periplaneta americana]|uniref:WAS/WASL-interacting protein family member 1-like isoform X2 n=1 Tax=Periplaneta americana TaxID=6978 RepID=UPI0037E8C778